MILTPKNWNTFQHYKDREPTWIKLHKGLLNDYQFSRLPVASRALAPMLWLLASEYDAGQIDATLGELSFRLHMQENELADALNPLIEAGFFTCDSEPLADCYQDACLEKEESKRREETDIRAVASATRSSARDFFEKQFWPRYPKREGSNPRKTALRAFEVAVKSGHDPGAISRGLDRDIVRWRSANQIGTRFIPQAVTWIQQARWDDHSDVEGAPPSAVGFPVKPESDQWRAWNASASPFQKTLMQRAIDTGQPFIAPSEWPPNHEAAA